MDLWLARSKRWGLDGGVLPHPANVAFSPVSRIVSVRGCAAKEKQAILLPKVSPGIDSK
jgi:hypothetical protein